MIKKFSRFLNRYKLHPVELNKSTSYELLFTSGSQSIDVTCNTVLISLDKPTIAIKLSDARQTENNFSLGILKNGALKATLKLKKLSLNVFTNDKSIYFFEVIRSNVEGRKPNKYFDILFLFLKNLTDKKTKNLVVRPASLISLFAFYIVPLPVYALSVVDKNEVDIFPDDILGNIHDNYYFFSVRTTNPSVKKIISQKIAALCLTPFNKKEEMYSLGKHHKNGVIDIDNLNFKLTLSHELKIPIPEFAINAIELKILESFEYSGYTVFYAESVRVSRYSEELPLAHTPWYNL